MLARAAVRALAAGAALRALALPAPAAAALGLAAGGTAIIERFALVRAVDGRVALGRAPLEASALTGLLLLLTYLQLVAVHRGALGPGGHVDGLAAMLDDLASSRARDLAIAGLMIAALTLSSGAISGAATLDRLDRRGLGFGGQWSLWLLGASLLVGLLAGAASLTARAPSAERVVAALAFTFVGALLAAVVLHLVTGVVFVLDRTIDRLGRLAGVRPSAVEARPA